MIEGKQTKLDLFPEKKLDKKTITPNIIAILGSVLIIILIVSSFWGGKWIIEKMDAWLISSILPLLISISSIFFWTSIFIVLPLAIFNKTRIISAVGFLIASYSFHITLYLWAFLLVYAMWGFWLLIINLIIASFFGMGAVFLAILATLFSREWSTLFALLLLVILIYSFQFIAFKIGVKYNK